MRLILVRDPGEEGDGYELALLTTDLDSSAPEVVAERRARAPWYRTKVDPSVADMLVKLRRVIIAAQFRPGLPPAPTAREINEVQMAWAAAGV